MRKQSPVRKPGFTLIEMAIVLVIIGLAAAMLLTAGSAMLDNQRRKAVRAQLDTLDNAMAQFVAVNKRLPCPADGHLPVVSPTLGVEVVDAGGTCNAAAIPNGILPWVTLGLSRADIVDPWGGYMTYRVDPALAAAAPQPLLMNMSNCDPSATGAAGAGGICITPAPPCTGTAGCTSPASFLANKGIDIWDGQNGAAGFAARQNNRILGTGAAYVIISHGPNGLGAYNTSAVLQNGDGIAIKLETTNRNNTPMSFPATQASVILDAPLNDNLSLEATPPGPPPPPTREFYFDDYLSHPTIMTVLNKANLGPRAH